MKPIDENIHKIMQAKKLEVDNLLELIVALLSRIESLEARLEGKVEVEIDDDLISGIKDKVVEDIISTHLIKQDKKINNAVNSLCLLAKTIQENLGE